MLILTFYAGSPSYKNQSTDLQSKSMDWFLYDRELSRERVKIAYFQVYFHQFTKFTN